MELNKNQKKAVFEYDGNCVVVASPGTGKTKTLVARAQNKIESLPRHQVLVLITYTNAAANEIASRLINSKSIFIGTIHSFCLEYILRPFSWINKWFIPRVISDEQVSDFIEQNTDIRGQDGNTNIIEELGKIKRRLDGSWNENVEWNLTIPLKVVAERYSTYKKDLKVIDFNEILYRSYKLICSYPFISTSVSAKCYEILVDEFQDTNEFQYEIFKIINNVGLSSFFLVGDPKQRIFTFAGAIEDAFEKAKEDFRAKCYNLTEAYRSTDNIVKTYSCLFDDHPLVENKSEWANIPVEVKIIETTKDNNSRIVEDILNRLNNHWKVKPDEIAILSTSWFSAYSLSKDLRRMFPLVGLGALPHKYINNSTMSLLQELSKYRVNSTIKNLRAIKRCVEVHLLENNLEISDNNINKATNYLITEFLKLDINKSIDQGLKDVRNIFNRSFKQDHVTFDIVLDKTDSSELNIWTLEKYINTLAGVGGIHCNTIHKAKGLEYDAVILNGMNENRIPHQKLLCRKTYLYQGLSLTDIEEGRNLFYVAVSRARKYLIVLHNWKPSMFISTIK